MDPNAAFLNDPYDFVQCRTVNSLEWFGRAVHSQPDLQLSHRVSLAKRGSFRLKAIDAGTVRLEAVSPESTAEAAFAAFWCPLVPGWGMPGFVEVPRRNPPFPFVFTTAMRDSALVVTDSPMGPNFFRLYHHQSPDDAAVWDRIHGVGMNVLSQAGFETYGVADREQGPQAVAFNFLCYRGGVWHYVFQPQYCQPGSWTVSRVSGAASILPVLTEDKEGGDARVIE